MLHQPSQVHGLLMQMKHKDNEATGTLYQHYQPIIYITARRRYGLSHEEAEDAVQQTFLRLLGHSLATYREEKKGGSAWLRLVVQSNILNILRDRRRQWQHELAVDPLQDTLAAPDEEEPEEAAIERELRAIAARTLNALSAQDREEIERGKNPGTTRNTLKQAVARAYPIFDTYYTANND